MREGIKKDRARIQVGRISNFGLLEMTRQRLREGSIKWDTILTIESFALKIIKKIEMLAFTNKIKYIESHIPEKVKLYIEKIRKKEIDYFQNKYGFKIDFIAHPDLIIPEYKIRLLNKNKKIVNKIENINKIEGLQVVELPIKSLKIEKKDNNKINKTVKSKKNVKNKKEATSKTPLKKVKPPRTLWVRKKKKS